MIELLLFLPVAIIATDFFIFEPYDIYYREVGIECYDLKQRKCLECVNKLKGEET
jgi:hypothetical protein